MNLSKQKITIIFLLWLIFIIFLLIFFKNYYKEPFLENVEKKDYKKTLIQTYKDYSLVPEKVHKNREKYIGDYDYIFFNDKNCEDFIKKNYSEEIFSTYKKTKHTAHKADLFRYCYLYLEGGLYCDIKTIFVKPLKDIFVNKDITYSVLSNKENTIYQGVIYTFPKNPLFLELINNFVKISRNEINDYHTFTADFYKTFSNKKDTLVCGDNKNIHLFKEICSKADNTLCEKKFDKYGYCCRIVDVNNNLIFKTRYPDFPW